MSHRERTVLSEDGDEASEDPLFEWDWSDAADDTSLLESFGSSPVTPPKCRSEQRSWTVGQTNEDWSDFADDEGVLEFGAKSANLDRLRTSQ
jgi:hypothetical protein